MAPTIAGRRFGRAAVVGILVATALVVPVVRGAAPADAATPAVSVRILSDSLVHPWDIAPMANGGALLGLRGGGFRYVDPAGALHAVTANTSDVFVSGEAGQAGLVLDPAFASNRNFYVCQSYQQAGQRIDIRVLKWTLAADNASAARTRTLLTGIPLSNGNAFHTGCRLRFAPDGTLFVGTGDALTGPVPQDLNSLGGKTLRINPGDGSAPADNPFASLGGTAALVYSYGHRNVQGLALRPGTTQMWSVEHGPDRDDEVNLLTRGGNYGWAPTRNDSSYDQSVPMTDTARFPAAVPARWRSGSPTVAPSGSTFLTGSKWGRWEGALAVAELKNQGVRVLTMTPDGRVTGTEQLPQLDNSYGRIRAVQSVPGGNAFYAITSNGSKDRLIRVDATTAQPAYRAGVDVSPSGVTAVALGSVVVVFVRGGNGQIYTSRQSAPGQPWSGFTAIPGVVGSAPAAVTRYGTHIDLFARGTNGHLLHTWTRGSGYAPWQDLGGVISSAPTTGSLSSDSLDVFVRAGVDDAVYRLRWTGSASWSKWTKIGGVLSAAPAVTADPARGRLTVYGRGTGGSLCMLAATATTYGTWSCGGGRQTWTAPGASQGASPLVVTRGADLTPVVATATGFVTAIGGQVTGASAIVTRSGGYAVLGRGGDNALWYYDGRPGKYTWTKVGGRLT